MKHQAWQTNPGDIETRSIERIRRATLSGFSSTLARGVQVLITMISVPLAVHYLGAERFGLWMTIYSLITILSFADFGIGSGLLNAIASSFGRQDATAAQEAISSAFFVLLGLSLAFSAVFASIYRFVRWWGLFNLHSAIARGEAGPAILAFFVTFVVALPFGIVQRIQLGLQQGYMNGLWSVAGNIAGLIGLSMSIREHLGLPWLILAIAGGPSTALVVNSVFLFVRRPDLRPLWSSFSAGKSKEILVSGMLFFVLQISMAIGYQSDNLVIAHVIGPDTVATYSITLRVFQLVPTLLGYFMVALWPAYGEAAERRDYAWIRTTYRKSMLVNAAVAAPSVTILLLTAPWLLHVWVGGSVTPSRLLLVGIAAYAFTSAAIGPISAMMNGMHILRFQAVSWSTMAVVNIVLSILLTRSIGTSGVAFGSAIAQILFIIVPSIWYIADRLSRLGDHWAIQMS